MKTQGLKELYNFGKYRKNTRNFIWWAFNFRHCRNCCDKECYCRITTIAAILGMHAMTILDIRSLARLTRLVDALTDIQHRENILYLKL